MKQVGMVDARGMNIMTEYVYSKEKVVEPGDVAIMSKKHALKELKRMYDDIDKDNHLFVGTIPPEMIAIAIEALEVEINALDNK